MEKRIKILSFLIVITCFFSCDENSSDLGFNPQKELGWIQFNSSTDIQTSQDLQEILRLGVNIQVPETSQDLIISYEMVSISGIDPNSVFSNNGQIISPAGQTSYAGSDNNTGIDYVYLPSIDFNISEISTAISEPMVFDVVLTGTNISSITVGLSGESFPTTQRIIICPSYDSADGNFLGDYVLTVPSGPSLFDTPIFTDGQVVTLSEGMNGSLSRQFNTFYLPAFSATPETISFSFSNGTILISDISTGTGCSSSIVIGGNPNQLTSVCGDSVITLNMLDFKNGTGGCGVADEPIIVLLTKVD